MIEKQNIGYVTRGVKLRRAVWNVACVVLLRPFPTSLFMPWRRLVLRLFGASVSRTAMVYSSVRIWAPWNLTLKRNACLGPNVNCYNQAMVTLEEGAVVSQEAYLCTAGHDISCDNNAESGLIVAPIVIRAHAWVGSRAFIGMGVEIGTNAVVGATASVYKDVEPGAVVGGNPAKLLKMKDVINHRGGVRHNCLFHSRSTVLCHNCGERRTA